MNWQVGLAGWVELVVKGKRIGLVVGSVVKLVGVRLAKNVGIGGVWEVGVENGWEIDWEGGGATPRIEKERFPSFGNYPHSNRSHTNRLCSKIIYNKHYICYFLGNVGISTF